VYSMLNEVKGQPDALRLALNQKEEVHRLAGLLKNKKRILFMGMGSSYLALKAAQNYLSKRIPGTIDLVTAGDVIFYFDETKRYDLVIIASQSGESIETLDAARKLKEYGLEIWTITNTKDSSLYSLADEKLLMLAGREVTSATKTYINLMALLFALGLTEGDPSWDDLLSIPSWMEACITECEKKAQQTAKELHQEGIRNLYVLGMGPHLVTAGEAALLFKEKVWLCTEGMNTAEFRHGPVEVIENGVGVFILGGNPEVEKFSLLVAKDLQSKGARVYFIGSDSESQGRVGYINCSCPNEEYLPFIQVIPFQFISFFLALEKGMNVEGFRHIGKVINSY
jgi:glucosamine--fructose-6-phosphate aminotransferase (isomerizing)